MKHQPQTITIDELRRIAHTRGKIAVTAQKALQTATELEERNLLASILLDRHLRHIQVYKL